MQTSFERAQNTRVADEAFLVEPEWIPFLFDGLRFVGFGNFRHGF
jgi:hypothetical protein